MPSLLATLADNTTSSTNNKSVQCRENQHFAIRNAAKVLSLWSCGGFCRLGSDSTELTKRPRRGVVNVKIRRNCGHKILYDSTDPTELVRNADMNKPG